MVRAKAISMTSSLACKRDLSLSILTGIARRKGASWMKMPVVAWLSPPLLLGFLIRKKRESFWKTTACRTQVFFRFAKHSWRNIETITLSCILQGTTSSLEKNMGMRVITFQLSHIYGDGHHGDVLGKNMTYR